MCGRGGGRVQRKWSWDRDDAEGSVSRREGARGLKGKSDMSGQTSERRGVWAFGAKCAGDSWVLGRSAGEVQRKDCKGQSVKGGWKGRGRRRA